MRFGLQRDKPNELELRRAALEADEHFCGLPVEVQDLKREALVENYAQFERIRKTGLARYRSAIILGVGMMMLFWGMGSAPHVDTFVAAVLLGVVLGAVTERIEAGTILFSIGCSLCALLLGTMTGTFVSLIIMPVAAAFLGVAIAGGRLT